MKGSVRRGCILLVMVLFFVILASPAATAYTTQVTIRRYAIDGLTPITETTKTYQWLEANLPVYGDGNTYYYFQGPIFEGEWETNYGVTFPEYRTDWGGTPPDWLNSSEKWDRYWNGTAYVQHEDVNWNGTENSPPKNLGKLKGTNVKDLCDLVGGLPEGKKVRVVATDNVDQSLPYSAVYTPTDQLGPYVITWWSVDAGESGMTSGYTGPDYTNGMRATFFSDTSRNNAGAHVAGLGDQAESLPSEYWYYFGGQYPSMGGWTLKYVDRIYVYSNDPVPPPVADFMANIKTGRIVNGNFETSSLIPWSVNGATLYTGLSTSYKHGNASVKLVAPASGSAWISQSVDLTGVSTINFYRDMFGGTGKYLQVYVDSTLVANYTETANPLIATQAIDISSYGFTGSHTLKFNAVDTLTSGTFTVYLDDIEDYGPGTSGNAPLIVQFKDLSTKMEDTAHTSWLWDFYNNGTATSTQQNPQFAYTANGTYTVKLTATNSGGSDTEIKTGYITVGTVTPPPVANFSANVTSGTAPLAVNFTDTSTGTGISAWQWDFNNDGTVDSTIQNPEYIYTSSGTYSVNLTVTGTGGTDTEVKTGYITVTGSPPVADFTADPLSGTAPLTVQFTDTSTNSPTSWKWAYKNASVGWTQFSTTQNPSYTFATGTYDINLTAENAGGSDDEIKTGYITVNAPLPVADFTALPLSGIAPLTIQFTDTSSNVPISWRWAYKNDTVGWIQFATAQNPSFTFAAGTYDINLTATNAGGSDDEIKEGYITVTEPPYIDIDLTGSISNWEFLTGTNDDTSSVDLSVSTNMDSWTVATRDALDGEKPSGTAGKMAEWNEPGYVPTGKVLANAMQVKAGAGSFITISGSDQVIITGTSPGMVGHDLNVRQVIAETDPALEGTNSYRIVITFTGSAA